MAKSKKRKNKKKNKKTKFLNINRDFLGIGIILVGIIYSLSLFNLNMGIVGRLLENTFFTFMGFGAYLLPILLFITGIALIVDRLENRRTIICSGIIFFAILIILDGVNPLNLGFIERIRNSIVLGKLAKGGGVIGSSFGFLLYSLFGSIGSYIILAVIIGINLLIIFNISLMDLVAVFKREFNKFLEIIKNKKEDKKLLEKPERSFKKKKNVVNTKNKATSDEDIKILDYRAKDPKDKKALERPEKKEEIDIVGEIEEEKSHKNIDKYIIPSLDLLNDPITSEDPEDDRLIRKNARLIKETMRNFNIEADVVQINKGPTITCYELEPAPGIKLSKIVSLSDNLALSLASSDIRIEAPIPGKSAVGIEVPNKIKSDVLLKELLLSKEYKDIQSKIPLALGKDVSGKVIVSSIDKMPHLLIAGATGSGKSVCINTIIMNILYKSSPEDVKLLLIDPKVVELSIYNGIPHLLIPVVTDAKKAAFALNWAVEEMEERYNKFAENNVRDIHAYNKKFKDDGEMRLPMIIIIIDELADLMMVSAQEVEDSISRIAQMARAAGMYLIVATQRPSVDVITGTIKANIPSRISFAVSSQIDSRTILDMGGAEKLLGKGDMLFYPSYYSKPTRIQGAFISDTEVEDIVESLKEDYNTEYDEEIIEVIQNKKEIDLDDSDELLPEAIELVVEEGQASISYLQRRLKVGYARAARMVDQMEDQGVVGGHEGSKPRKVLITEESLAKIDEEE